MFAPLPRSPALRAGFWILQKIAGERGSYRETWTQGGGRSTPLPWATLYAPPGLKTRSLCEFPYPLCPAKKIWGTIRLAMKAESIEAA